MLEETNTQIDSVSLPLQDQLLETKAPETLQEALANVEEQAVLAYVRQHGAIGRRDCVELLGVKAPRASYLLRGMCSRGLLVMTGQRRWARYELPTDDGA